MILKLEPSLTKKIEQHYEEWMACCLNRKNEVDAWISKASEDEAICMRYLYAYMHPCDIVSYDVEVIASYVKTTLDMYANIPYAKQVPPELFFTYVLSVRVNNEDLDQSRAWIYSELAERVKSKKTMVEAALEVNYWCYEKATYIPSDGRTLAPFGMCRSARGRCGEESTLAVSAMRSVGIPARQCYVPRWAHCDDNHAWVEVWADGDWHYLGACEPEAVLDKGWFTAAASKAMLVHAKAFSDLESSAEIAYKTPLYALMNVTGRYADCECLTVTVTHHGVPVQNVTVAFSLVNYSELFPLHTEKTASDGTVSFLTGKGDLYVSCVYNGKYLGKKVDMRVQQSIVLEMEEAVNPEKMKGVTEEHFDLNPPYEAMPKNVNAQLDEHEARLAQCEKIRAAYEAGFVKEEVTEDAEGAQDADVSDAKTKNKDPWHCYLVNARGNREEIEKFRADNEFSNEDKCLMLDTLREKDFLDTSADVLASYLRAALPYKESFSKEVYQKYLLAPRAGDEKLMGSRGRIAQLIEEKNIFSKDMPITAQMIWFYVNHRLKTVPDYGTGNWPAEADGCIKCEIITEASKRVVFVEICRAMGIPARLNPVTGKAEAVFEKEGKICFEAMETEPQKKEVQEKQLALTLGNKSDRKLEYWLHMTIARFENGAYQTLNYEDLALELGEEKTIFVAPGAYRTITTRRQIDGGVSCIANSFVMNADRTLELTQAPAQIAEKCHEATLSDTMVQQVTMDGSAVGEPVSVTSLYQGQKSILIVADPGKEPTEHLFQEILECEEAYKKENYRIVIMIESTASLKNLTLQRVLNAGLNLVCVTGKDDAYLYQIHEALHVGDQRLPYALAINRDGKGLFAFSNYNIRTAWTLMEILDARG